MMITGRALYGNAIGRLILLIGLLAGAWQLSQGIYIHAKALLAQQLLELSWAETRRGQYQSPPWPWADTWPVARLQVPRLGVDLIVLAGDTGRSLAFGPGHNPASARPGDKGNVLISAHRDTHFAFLERVQQGEVITIETAQGKRIAYRVDLIQIMEANHAYLPYDEQVSRLHLVTCYPFHVIQPGGMQRFVVSAVEI